MYQPWAERPRRSPLSILKRVVFAFAISVLVTIPVVILSAYVFLSLNVNYLFSQIMVSTLMFSVALSVFYWIYKRES